MCDDCVKFLTDAQTEAKANTSFVNSLIENIENQCDLLGSGLSAMVRGSCLYQWVLLFFGRSRNQTVFPSSQCKQYVDQYGSLVIQQLMSMVSVLLMHQTVF